MSTGESKGRIEIGYPAWHPAFSPDGKILFAITADRHVRGWKVDTLYEVVCSASPLPNAATACTAELLVSPDGRFLAIAQMPMRGMKSDTILVFDARTGDQKLTGDSAPGQPRIAFSGDGRAFAAVTSSRDPSSTLPELSIWDTATGKLKVGLPSIDGQPAFSPDGRTVAVTHERGVLLIELATGRTRHEFRHFGRVEPALAWRADGRVLASASPEAPIYLWDVVGDRTTRPGVWEPAHDDRRWSSLCANDAADAFHALRELAAHPQEAVQFLKTRPVPYWDSRLAIRVCEALEMIRTPEARNLLAAWAKSEKEATALSNEAASSLQRLPPV